MSAIIQSDFKEIRRVMSDEEHCSFANQLVANDQGLRVRVDRLPQTKSLSFLRHYNAIRYLIVENTRGSLGFLGEFDNLLALFLNRTRVPDFASFPNLESLEYLSIGGGRIDWPASLAKLHSLRAIDLSMIRGLSDLSFLGELIDLELIVIARCPSVTSLPKLGRHKSLRRVQCENLSGLVDVSGLSHISSKHDVVLIECHGLDVDALKPLVSSRNLESILPGIGTMASNKYMAACKLLGDRLMDGFYGTTNEAFEFELRS